MEIMQYEKKIELRALSVIVMGAEQSAWLYRCCLCNEKTSKNDQIIMPISLGLESKVKSCPLQSQRFLRHKKIFIFLVNLVVANSVKN